VGFVIGFFLRALGLATRSVMSMMTEPTMGPEQGSPRRRHWLQSSGVSSHYHDLVALAGGRLDRRTFTRRSRHWVHALLRWAFGMSNRAWRLVGA
jgi:hypothetical protein